MASSQAPRLRCGAGRLARACGARLALALAAGCGGAPETIRIGVVGPLSDPAGAPMRLAANLAATEINATGGIAGRPLELVLRDDFADPDSATFVASELHAAGVVAVVGHPRSVTTIAAAPVYGDGDDPVALISPSSSAAEISALGEHVFRVCPSDLAYSEALARWARERLGLRRGAVLYSNDPYGRALRAAFLRDFARLDGEVVAVDPYLAEAPEVGAYLDRAARGASRPDFFLLAGSRDEAEALLRQMRERRLRLPVLGPSGLEGVEAAGPLAESTYVATAYLPGVASPANRRFLAAWRGAHPSAAPPNQSAAATYDALHLLRDVIERVGAERAAVRRGLAEVGSVAPAFEGATGTIAFDAAGDVPSARVFIGLARGGALVPAEGS